MTGHATLSQAISARITALELARHEMGAHPDDAGAAIRRIAQGLKTSDIAHSYPEIAQATAALLRSRRPDSVAKQASRLIEALKSATVGGACKVLLVDDDRLLGAIIKDVLSSPEIDVVVAESLSSARGILETQQIAVIILDLILPDGDGRSLLLEIRETPRTAMVPVFIITGKTGPQAMTECIALGADAFFEKPVNPHGVKAAVEQKINRASPAQAADPLADLLTRADLISALKRDRADDAAQPLAVALVAIDDLSEAIRKGGSTEVEAAVVTMMGALCTHLPASAAIGRWTGSEFLCLLRHTSAGEAAVVLQSALSASRDVQAISFSAGVVAAEGSTTFDEVMADAERYLSTARLLGGNRVGWEGSKELPAARSVLFVEDDPVTASLVMHRLKRDGFDVVHAADGVRAVEAIPTRAFALAIIESNTPGLDGFSVLARFRANPTTRTTPVIMLSAIGNERDVVRCFEHGADDYIMKPFSPIELLARVHRLLARR